MNNTVFWDVTLLAVEEEEEAYPPPNICKFLPDYVATARNVAGKDSLRLDMASSSPPAPLSAISYFLPLKPINSRLVPTFLATYGTRRFITVCTKSPS
jgi:hypothetical protein